MARFVDLDEIDSRYFEKPYYLLPDGGEADEGYVARGWESYAKGNPSSSKNLMHPLTTIVTGMISPSAALAPTPAASDARPVGTQAA
jgi:hypothetical protein